MLGFILGTLCLVALIGTLRRHHYAHLRYAYGMPYGHASCGDPGYGHPYGLAAFGGYRPGSRRGLIRGLFEQLDTTPGQEKAIVNALDSVRERFAGLREGFDGTRSELATALEGESFDRSRVEGAFARQASQLGEGRDAVIGALASIHAALDERQRKELGRLIAQRGFRSGFCLHRGLC
ncbi:MAG TPA: periplasmic heavy metal sensor [Polyangiales bacterium]